MSRIGLQEVTGVVDPVNQYQFELIVPNIPGGGDSRNLAIICQTSSLPGKSFDDVTYSLHGIDLKQAGRPMYSHTLQAQFLLARDMKGRDTIKNWMDYVKSIKNNTGTYKAQYTTTVQLLVYDAAQNVIRTITLYNCFPQTMDDSAVDGSSSAPVTVNVTFAYDYFFDDNDR